MLAPRVRQVVHVPLFFVAIFYGSVDHFFILHPLLCGVYHGALPGEGLLLIELKAMTTNTFTQVSPIAPGIALFSALIAFRATAILNAIATDRTRLIHSGSFIYHTGGTAGRQAPAEYISGHWACLSLLMQLHQHCKAFWQ
jgi:hypothetical protein